MFFLGNGDFLFLAMSDTSPCPEQTLHHIVLRGSPLEIHGAVFLHDLENLIPDLIGLLHVLLCHRNIGGSAGGTSCRMLARKPYSEMHSSH